MVRNLQYNVKLDAFEGPLDLLLHLINTLEIDIYDIPVSKITEQYLLYIQTMKELKLDIASEYLVMAATLLAIKSKMLLPKYEEDLYDDEMEINLEQDPRDELVERLIEYRKYKEAAHDLKNLEEERGLMYTKAPSDLTDLGKEEKFVREELNVSLYDMLSAFQKLMRRKKLQRPMTTRIARQEISIETRMSEIIKELKAIKRRISFNELFPIYQREHIVVTFLAVLELMKRNEIKAEQEENFGEIFVVASEGAESIGHH
ncbi:MULTISPECIES: segregation/condensation protein A [unclassified Bacillus (in: firmicutes)]|uniref:segregation/condensation protein A n=1 Tax=unclassified Bacillus (in: firmicutes) TaxID=185979 RepID=UPI0008F43E63|nr:MULTISPECIES: segregation/condensation protein A [unclassified Bacillus (in: firmicutes)]SFA97914.1 condensin subunit ScpA [Bacillus sp. UNCCL13]SFQ80716.1 condensin subunit ScpA [Bacillus sp. cl95]